MISTAFAIQAISIPAYVSLDICYVSGCVTYLQDIDFARLLSCGDVERKTEVLTVSSLHLSIDEVRTGVFRGTVTLSLSFRAKTISGPSLYSQLSQLLPRTVILFSTFAEYSAYPPSLPFYSFFCPLCIFSMALPFENMPLEARRVERERQRRLVFALSCTDATVDCLASMASDHLDRHFRLEDAVLAAGAPEVPAAERLEAFLAAIRVAIPESTRQFGQLYAAARYGCSAVGDALHVDEDVPGLSGAQLKAIRANHLAEEQARTAAATAAATGPVAGSSSGRLNSCLV